jgi:hypothetical protein
MRRQVAKNSERFRRRLVKVAAALMDGLEKSREAALAAAR